MPSTPSSNTALVRADTPVNLDVLAKYIDACCIHSSELDEGGFLYIIECKNTKQYDDYNGALTATEIHLKTKCFKRVLDDSGKTEGRIILNPSRGKNAFRPAWPAAPSDLLIPGLERLSKQLQVDFATNVHGKEGCRKREKTKTIYDDHKAEPLEPAQKYRKTAHKTKSDEQSAIMRVVMRSHAAEMAAKDRTIEALKKALEATSRLAKTQAEQLARLSGS